MIKLLIYIKILTKAWKSAIIIVSDVTEDKLWIVIIEMGYENGQYTRKTF